MAQTVWSSIKSTEVQNWLASIEVMQIDECHNFSGAETFYRTGLHCASHWRLGYSGTPFSQVDIESGKFNPDNWRLVGLLGPPIYEVTLAKLQSLGLMVPVTVIQVKQEGPADVADIDGNDWHSVHSAGVVENPIRNQKIIDIASLLVKRGYLPMILIKIVDHGDALFNGLQSAGLQPIYAKGNKNIRMCTGDKSEWIRGSIGEAYQSLVKGHGNILISTQIGDEGVDFPSVDALILGVGGKADQVTTQRIFRPLTSTATKTRSIVVDFDDRQHGVLKKHSAMRRRIYRMLGFDALMVSMDKLSDLIPVLDTAE
jgi:superfamily II DNA or RNA helicase